MYDKKANAVAAWRMYSLVSDPYSLYKQARSLVTAPLAKDVYSYVAPAITSNISKPAAMYFAKTILAYVKVATDGEPYELTDGEIVSLVQESLVDMVANKKNPQAGTGRDVTQLTQEEASELHNALQGGGVGKDSSNQSSENAVSPLRDRVLSKLAASVVLKARKQQRGKSPAKAANVTGPVAARVKSDNTPEMLSQVTDIEESLAEDVILPLIVKAQDGASQFALKFMFDSLIDYYALSCLEEGVKAILGEETTASLQLGLEFVEAVVCLAIACNVPSPDSSVDKQDNIQQQIKSSHEVSEERAAELEPELKSLLARNDQLNDLYSTLTEQLVDMGVPQETAEHSLQHCLVGAIDLYLLTEYAEPSSVNISDIENNLESVLTDMMETLDTQIKNHYDLVKEQVTGHVIGMAVQTAKDAAVATAYDTAAAVGNAAYSATTAAAGAVGSLFSGASRYFYGEEAATEETATQSEATEMGVDATANVDVDVDELSSESDEDELSSESDEDELSSESDEEHEAKETISPRGP